jgi:hypothetical protein
MRSNGVGTRSVPSGPTANVNVICCGASSPVGAPAESVRIMIMTRPPEPGAPCDGPFDIVTTSRRIESTFSNTSA